MAVTAVAHGADFGSVADHASLLPLATSLAWTNPALAGMEYSTSLSRLAAGYSRTPERREWGGEAATYIHAGPSTITGHAAYANGTLADAGGIMNADPEEVYPYLTYIDATGDMHFEQYTFGGSWSGCVGSFLIGARGGYDAKLSYRSSDPRPRNVTGNLDVAVGAAYAIGRGYLVALHGTYNRYTQSSDIAFKSEMGESTIYHLVGPGIFYNRFTGLGHTASYGASTFSVGATVFPSVHGFYASAEGAIMRMNHILVDLNKLPMARVDERTAAIEAGWRGKAFSIVGTWRMERRHGYENIFGDAAAGQYPLIATLGMFSHTLLKGELRAAGQCRAGAATLSGIAGGGWISSEESYRQPAVNIVRRAALASLQASAAFPLPRGLILSARAEGRRAFAKTVDWEDCAGASAELLVPIGHGRFVGASGGYASLRSGNSFFAQAVFTF